MDRQQQVPLIKTKVHGYIFSIWPDKPRLTVVNNILSYYVQVKLFIVDSESMILTFKPGFPNESTICFYYLKIYAQREVKIKMLQSGLL